jgi:hypothetical protein
MTLISRLANRFGPSNHRPTALPPHRSPTPRPPDLPPRRRGRDHADAVGGLPPSGGASPPDPPPNRATGRTSSAKDRTSSPVRPKAVTPTRRASAILAASPLTSPSSVVPSSTRIRVAGGVVEEDRYETGLAAAGHAHDHAVHDEMVRGPVHRLLRQNPGAYRQGLPLRSPLAVVRRAPGRATRAHPGDPRENLPTLPRADLAGLAGPARVRQKSGAYRQSPPLRSPSGLRAGLPGLRKGGTPWLRSTLRGARAPHRAVRRDTRSAARWPVGRAQRAHGGTRRTTTWALWGSRASRRRA